MALQFGNVDISESTFFNCQLVKLKRKLKKKKLSSCNARLKILALRPQFEQATNFSILQKEERLEIDSWSEIGNSICKSSYPSIFMFGERKMGKTLFARYLANRLLNIYSEIDWIETDLAKPEFTVNGMISYNVVTQPVLSTPNIHLETPEQCRFLGTQDLSNIRNYIIQCCDIIDQVKRTIKLKPIIINTQGWAIGAGLDLLLPLLQKAKPSHIICFMNDWHIESTKKCIEMEIDSNILFVRSFKKTKKILGYKSFSKRRLLIYLQFRIDFSHIYSVSFSTVAICILQEQVHTRLIFNSFIDQIIVLIKVNELKLQNGKLNVLKQLPKKHYCLGIGLICGIDINNNRFLIYTPYRWINCNVLIKSNIWPPKELLYQACNFKRTKSLLNDGLNKTNLGIVSFNERFISY